VPCFVESLPEHSMGTYGILDRSIVYYKKKIFYNTKKLDNNNSLLELISN